MSGAQGSLVSLKETGASGWATSCSYSVGDSDTRKTTICFKSSPRFQARIASLPFFTSIAERKIQPHIPIQSRTRFGLMSEKKIPHSIVNCPAIIHGLLGQTSAGSFENRRAEMRVPPFADSPNLKSKPRAN
jgi:hypothetical protein